MTQQTQAVATRKEDKALEFIPFGSEDKIRLTIDIVKNTIAIPTKSGKLPQDKDIVKFMMMCQAQRLNPYAGDAYLTGYDSKDGPQFSLITAHQALLKRAEVSEHFLGMLSGIIVVDEQGAITEIEGDFYTKEQEVIGGWAKVFHAKRKDYPFYRRIRMERFNKGFAQWQVDAAGMICKCAEADALRSAFPTMLGGLYIAEEQNLPTDIGSTVSETVGTPKVRPLATPKPEAIDVTPARTVQQDLESIIIEAGYDFSAFQKWGAESGNVPDADSLASFDEVPKEVAVRLLRSKAGLLATLEATKGAA